MLVAAPLSFIAVWAFLPIRRVHLAAKVGLSSLSDKFASLDSSEAFSLDLLTVLAKLER
jgi:hypothetical protein